MMSGSVARHDSRFVTLPNGLLHHYATVGDRGPKIVLLHGYADSWRSFEPLFKVLGRDAQLFALDQRGHGHTEPGGRYAMADLAQDAIDFIATVAREPVHLVGHSLGAIVAQRAAERRPDLLRSLTIIGGARSAAAHPGLAALRVQIGDFGDAIPPDFIKAFQESTVSAPLRPSRLAAIVKESRKLRPETWRNALEALLNEPRARKALEIRVPALSLWGVEDGVFHKGEQVALSRAIPHLETIHYAGLGHAPHWEAPDRVARDIRSFALAVAPGRLREINRERPHAW
ncbi:alpha/beta fold hydrolase [Hansschlegelia plantiphila]|uniref:Alpha/beta hydrolase n=1 Tax=Hansschlegelia plantiphila TaxID=374655 RepID=A0A9W6MWG5_9HYPH|nr:alpha/beta hydrolase [Hansschlegelia plantiphila]GLK68996.1 alpha/beta hydrolase [Hansschlegelia plantiphila]